MSYIIKKTIQKLISFCKTIIHYPFRPINMTDENAVHILNKAGYIFTPLFKEMPPLKASTMDLSIIIPVYNDEKFLPRLLDAILNQKTKYKYEVICINDGSTDSSQSILEKYKMSFPTILTIIKQKNCGISTTRNRGIAIAKGEYVGFIDDDDMIEPDYVETIMQRAKSFDADIVQTAFSSDDIDGNTKNVHSKPDINFSHDTKLSVCDNVSGYIWGGYYESLFFYACDFLTVFGMKI